MVGINSIIKRSAGWLPAIGLAAGIGFALSGCTRPPEEDAQRIQFSIWGSVQQQQAEQQIIDAFEEEHPDIKVDLYIIGARYADQIQAMMVGNVAPDVFMVNLYNYYEWASRGVLEDLTEEYEALAEEAEFLHIPDRIVRWNDRIYSFPINAHGHVTFTNFDALEEAGIELPEEGLTWEFMEEIAPRLSRRHGNPDAPTDYLFQMPAANIIFWQHGVQFFDDLSQPTEVTINTPEAVEALKFIRRMYQSGYVVPEEVVADEGTYQLFRDGRVAFYFNGRWMTPEFDGRTDFEWDVRPMVTGPESGITQHGGTTLGVWSGSHRQEAARKFARFYASKKGATMAMHFQRNVPPYREAAYGDEYLSLRPPESMHHFSETMEEGASQFILYAPGVQEVARLFTARMQQALAQPSIPPEQIIRGMEEDFERWLQRMKERGIL